MAQLVSPLTKTNPKKLGSFNQSCKAAPALYVMVFKAPRMIKGIPLLEPKVKQLINGHFVND
jgi:hypothetical protein